MQINDSPYFQITKYEDTVIEWYLRFAVNFLDGWGIELGFQNISSTKYIVDEYFLRINYSLNVPTVFEIGGKIKQILQRINITNENIHINFDWSCCLAPSPFLINFFDSHNKFSEIIEHLIIPFFWWLSFYQKNNKRPNKEYSHWDLGILEYFFELSNNEQILYINNFEFQNLWTLSGHYLFINFKKFLYKNRNVGSVRYFLIENNIFL
jgi:hypothetical protein